MGRWTSKGEEGSRTIGDRDARLLGLDRRAAGGKSVQVSRNRGRASSRRSSCALGKVGDLAKVCRRRMDGSSADQRVSLDDSTCRVYGQGKGERTAARHDVEEGTLADVGHADNADLQVVARASKERLLLLQDVKSMRDTRRRLSAGVGGSTERWKGRREGGTHGDDLCGDRQGGRSAQWEQH